jgi:hypothetical protein
VQLETHRELSRDPQPRTGIGGERAWRLEARERRVQPVPGIRDLADDVLATSRAATSMSRARPSGIDAADSSSASRSCSWAGSSTGIARRPGSASNAGVSLRTRPSGSS